MCQSAAPRAGRSAIVDSKQCKSLPNPDSSDQDRIRFHSPCVFTLYGAKLDVKIRISNFVGERGDEFVDCRVRTASRGDAGCKSRQSADDAADCRADPGAPRVSVQGPSGPGPCRGGRVATGAKRRVYPAQPAQRSDRPGCHQRRRSSGADQALSLGSASMRAVSARSIVVSTRESPRWKRSSGRRRSLNDSPIRT